MAEPVEGVCGEGAGGGEEAAATSAGREIDDEDLIHEILSIIESISRFGEFRKTQRRECLTLVRRMKMVMPLIEELQELEQPIPNAAYGCLSKLIKALSSGRKLLRFCHDGSKIYLALEGEAVMARFHKVYEQMYQALIGMPYEELHISDEVKEQVELMHQQLKKAKRRNDTQDMELVMDMMVVFSDNDDRNADRAILERLGIKLELQSLPDLRAENMAIKKLIKERSGLNAESTQQIINLLKKFQEVAGVVDGNGLTDLTLPKYLEKCPSLLIPNEFMCPISLEIMTDPVIVATGQTYERQSIKKWFDAGHKTCPKTRQTLAHLILAPNYALRNLIMQWCEKNKVELLKREEDQEEEAETKEEVPSLIKDLSSIHLDVQRKAVKKIRMLSKENTDNRVLIAQNGGIPPLISLLSYPDSKIQENTVTALLNLSIDEGNKQLIAEEGAIPAIIDILKNGTTEAKENSAAALFSLSMQDELKVMIGNLDGIPPLVDLLKNGTIRGKKDATTALFNLVLNNKNRARAIEAGIVPPLLQVVNDKNMGMVDEILSIFLLLASHPDGQKTLVEPSFIQTLVHFIKEGTPKNQECAISVLLELGIQNPTSLSGTLQVGLFDHLSLIVKNGTNRAQRKARSLMLLMTKSEQSEHGHVRSLFVA